MGFAAVVRSFAIIARPRRSIAVVAARVPWFAITGVRFLLVACAACAAAPTPLVAKKVSGPSHDPDHARGPLPTVDARKSELGLVRHDLDAMYAHRLAKIARYQLDEDKIFADAEQKLLAAASWASYDAALYNALAKFRDGHLTYRPPQTAAPKVGYASFRLGLRTVLANDQLLIADVDPGSDVATAGVTAGDEVTSIDGVTVAAIFEREAATRSDARPESALASFAKSWSSVLYPKGDPPRLRKLVVAKRAGGDVTVTITPKPAEKVKHEAISIEKVGDVAVVTIRVLEGNPKRGDEIDKALGEARAAKGIVVDLRGDRGGVDKVGYRVVAGLAPGKAVIARYRVLAAPETLARRPQWKDLKPEADGFSPEQITTIDGLGAAYAGKIAIVVDAGCISTCEVVASAVRADSHATVIGEVTGGSSGAPVSVTLPASRGTIQIPSWNLTTADGKTIEDDGITPDVISVPTAEALADHRDAVLEAAIAAAKP
jgi:carboxyl-terminal processing protease